MGRPLVEVCVESADGVRVAAECGADRAELCANLLEGGVTPSAGAIRLARRFGIPVMVIVRPRGGDFLYGALEYEVMEQDVEMARECGAEGVVLGILHPDGSVDEERTARLVERARPLPVTFHRAFDMTPDPRQALETLIRLGVDRVLSSGQEDSAAASIPLLAELVRQAGDRILVMPGAGLSPDNVREVALQTGAREIHFAALAVEDGPMVFRNPRLGMGAGRPPGEFERKVTDPELVRRFMGALEAP